MRWKAQASAVRPKPGADGKAAPPKWNPSPADLEPVEKSLAFIATQQARGAKRRVAQWREQKATVFSGLYGYHFGEGTLPEDGMEGLARGEDDERAFDAPLKVRRYASAHLHQTPGAAEALGLAVADLLWARSWRRRLLCGEAY